MTKEDKIKIFTEAVYKYQKEFNLLNWEIAVSEFKSKENRGMCYFTLEDRICNICYEKNWIEDEDTEEIEVRKVAFHEVIELFLSRLSVPLGRYYVETYVYERVHEIIRVLENIFIK